MNNKYHYSSLTPFRLTNDSRLTDDNKERLNRWVQVSMVFSHVEPFMIPVLQGLGNMDCQLIQQDDRFNRLGESAE